MRSVHDRPTAALGRLGTLGRGAAVLACLAALAAAGCSREGSDRSAAGGARPAAAGAPSSHAVVPNSPSAPASAPAVPSAPVPDGDAFFDPPVPLPQVKPGDVIRQRPFDVPQAGLAGAAKQILVMYATTGYDGKPVATTGLVFLPPGPAPAGGWPVATTDHGTLGSAAKCGPSRGTWAFLNNDPDAGPGLADTLLAQGFAVVQPDYLGLGATGTPHAYLYAKSAAYSTLDLIRAARNLTPDIGKSTILTGNSQGGHAALWSGHYAPEYAPELDVKGIIAEAPAVGFDAMPDLVAQQSEVSAPYVGIFLTLVRAASLTDPNVKPEAFLTPAALAQVRFDPQECFGDTGPMPAPDNVLLPNADLGPIKAYLTANATSQVKLRVPVLLTQGGRDILSSMNKSLAQDLCARSAAAIEFKPYPDGAHTLGESAVADDVAWIQARLAGTPVTGACTFEP